MHFDVGDSGEGVIFAVAQPFRLSRHDQGVTGRYVLFRASEGATLHVGKG
jgi:hypothetical protein